MKAELVLVAGMVVGAGWAVAELARVPASDSTNDVAAWVDDYPILLEDYERALQAVARDRKAGSLEAADRQRVLNRLIDERLLLEHGIELGLARRDPQLRNLLATQVMTNLAEAARSDEPSERALREFHKAESFRFREPAQFVISHAFFRGEDAQARAERARTADPLVGDDYGLPLPSGPILAREIQQILGVEVARAVAELGVGETSAPIATDSGAHVVRVLERRGGDVRSFDSVRDQVLDAYRRVEADRAVRTFLDQERRRRNVRIVVETAP